MESHLEKQGGLLAAIKADVQNCTPDAPKLFAINRLVARVMHKLEPQTLDEQNNANRVALDKFLEANSRAGQQWPLAPETDIDRQVDAQYRHNLWREVFGYSLGENYADAWDLGPGASRGAKTNDVYTKLYGGPLTTTSKGLYTRYVHSLLGSPSMLAAEKQRRRCFEPFRVVAGSKMAFVKKDSRTSRIIGTEPLLNMLAQKAVAAFLECRLKRSFGINLADQQEYNKALARHASAFGDYATLDLSSASDTISMSFCRWALPPSFMRVLCDTRSPFIELPDGSSCELNMIAGMGCAFTFPLETLLFAHVVRAVYATLDISHKERINVFGDDIICLTQAADLVVRTLERYGFIVNAEKSFAAGPFRESCGGDYYLGRQVKPVYIRRLNRKTDYISAFNRLRLWSIYHTVPLFRTLLFLRRCIGKCSVVQPFQGQVDLGIMCTRAQAFRRGCKVASAEYGQLSGVVKYRSYCFHITDGSTLGHGNPDAELMSVLSGKMRQLDRPRGDYYPLVTHLKEKTVKLKREFRYTSVWQDPAFVAGALYEA